MSHPFEHNAPPPPEHNGWDSYSPQEPPRKKPSRTGAILLSGLVGVLVGVGGTLGAVALTNGFGTDDTVADANDTADQPSVEPEPAAPSTEADPTPDLPSPSPSPAELTVDDFDVETSVKEQSCFGSAGCNITLRTEPVFVGSGLPTGVWEVTYEITGIEDGPTIRTFEVFDDEVSFDDEVRVRVESENFDIQTEITDVREGFERR